MLKTSSFKIIVPSILAVMLAGCQTSSGSAPVAVTATTTTIVMPIRTSNVRLTYDLAAASPIATVAYTRETLPINEYLNVNNELYPAIRNATGCTPLAQASDNQLLPPARFGVTRIQLQC